MQELTTERYLQTRWLYRSPSPPVSRLHTEAAAPFTLASPARKHNFCGRRTSCTRRSSPRWTCRPSGCTAPTHVDQSHLARLRPGRWCHRLYGRKGVWLSSCGLAGRGKGRGLKAAAMSGEPCMAARCLSRPNLPPEQCMRALWPCSCVPDPCIWGSAQELWDCRYRWEGRQLARKLRVKLQAGCSRPAWQGRSRWQAWVLLLQSWTGPATLAGHSAQQQRWRTGEGKVVARTCKSGQNSSTGACTADCTLHCHLLGSCLEGPKCMYVWGRSASREHAAME